MRLRRKALALALVVGGIATLGSQAPAGAATAYDAIGAFPTTEGSGLVASRTYPGVFWALRDSGNPAELYAFKVVGGRLVDLVPGARFKTFPVLGARNIDWEALSIDWHGNLYIGDIGNNGCKRSNLAIHQLAEPNPYTATALTVKQSWPVAWPDPASDCTGYDAEAMFSWQGQRYVVSKSARPAVYRMATQVPGQRNRLEKVADLTPPPGGFNRMPTDASISPDGQRLAVSFGLYQAYVYRVSQEGLAGEATVRDLVAHAPEWTKYYNADHGWSQVEGAAFTASGHDLLLLSEQRQIRYFSRGFYEAS